MPTIIRFIEIEGKVPREKPGIYEIHTDTGIALKVGIGSHLRERLLQHRASRDSALKLKEGGTRENPNDVESKGSILAKHLYYDESITRSFDMKTQAGCRAFLEQLCYIVFDVTDSLSAADEEEKRRERSGSFRYLGSVVKR